MNRILLCLAFLAVSLTALSQKVYFIYFQSESGQPFYIKINEKVHSSTSSGYLILPKLKDSTYSFSLGFPGNKWPEQIFAVDMARRDHGFLIKNFGDKGWGLFDLQNLVVKMPVQAAARTELPAKTENKDASDFTNVLSKAADDPSLKEKPAQPKVEEVKNIPPAQDVVKKDPPVVVGEKAEVPVKEKTSEITALPQKDSKPVDQVMDTIGKKTEPVVESKTTEPGDKEAAIKEEPSGAQPEDTIRSKPYVRSAVTKKSESSTTEGFGLTFIDTYEEGLVDTIKLIIPNQKPALVQPVVKTEPKEEKKFLEVAAADTIKTQEVKDDTAVKEGDKPVIKNDCPAIADENDFLRIRKRMAAETSDDNMINEARKYFKTKCFSTVQVKNLSLLFLNDEGKYRFFDMTYPYVSDMNNFQSLQSELKDTYYINRFRAMLRL